jgi:hypoxanthine phosphoribosyltransferase
VKKEVLLSRQEIEAKVRELAELVSRDYQGKNLLLICVLKGAVVFLCDLLRLLKVGAEIDFMAVSSYGNSSRSSGVVRILKDLDQSIDQ